jgi:hypothetical protein
MRRVFLLIFPSLFVGLLPAHLREEIEPFLETHCYACHDDFDNEGGLNLLDLKFDSETPENRKIWEQVFRRVEEGEMPPKKKKRPAKEAISKFLGTLEAPLIKADLSELAKSGRVHSRRLTAQEYENALHDLLSIDIPLAEELTADADEGFTTTAETQQISHFHLNNYLRVSNLALEEAFERALKGDASFRKELSAKEVCRPGRGNNRGPQLWKGKAISWFSRLQFAGRITKTRVPASGWYRVIIHNVDAVNPGPDGYTWGTLQTGSGFSNEPLLYHMGLVEATDKPATLSFEGWMQKDHVLILKPNEAGLKSAPSKGGNFNFGDRDLEKSGFTGLRFDKITIQRIYPNAPRPLVRSHLFGKVNPNEAGEATPASLGRLIDRFASRAFRRPIDPSQTEPYRKLALSELKSGKSFPQALRSAYHAILCSPYFLTFVEKPGPLDDHAIATRLSFLLWKTIPDGPLRKLADEKKLRDPKVLHQQIGRLLAHPKAARFIEDFTDQWLDLRDIDATQPDPKRFRNFDPPLQLSLRDETQSFIAALISENRPVTELLKSEIGFLNTRLRDHYKLKEVKITPGKGLQKVSLAPGQRSGLLTQASILKVSADGSVTSPVLRGVWVNERILGRHIPPPPENVPAIEPDIRGAVSIRDQLAKHTDPTSCASCHDKIDPSGFALESFDPIGQFRVAYGAKKTSAKVDPSGITPDGLKFDSFFSWRKIYLKKPEMLARAFISQILRYGVGGELRFSDRPHLESIIKQAAGKNHGLRTLIHAALASEIFLNK